MPLYIAPSSDSDVVLFTGSGNPALAAEVAMALGIQLGRATVSKFKDGEVCVVLCGVVLCLCLGLLCESDVFANDIFGGFADGHSNPRLCAWQRSPLPFLPSSLLCFFLIQKNPLKKNRHKY
jgi:hypothetical protein